MVLFGVGLRFQESPLVVYVELNLHTSALEVSCYQILQQREFTGSGEQAARKFVVVRNTVRDAAAGQGTR